MEIEIEIGENKYTFEEYSFDNKCPECHNLDTITRNRGDIPKEIDFFTFFACPKCGFAESGGNSLPKLKNEDFWKKFKTTFQRIIKNNKKNITLDDILTYIKVVKKDIKE